jgi:CRISPR/Cas system endoribonuclease Cas6 (RAMP superfamily)
VFESLIELKRLPVLLIFDTHNQKKLTAQIVEMSNVLTHLDINNVGIYFRLPNNDTGKQFNEIVAERKYNTILDKNTQVMGVETNKLPKFILRNDWKPMSVIVVNTNLRNSKTAIYSTCCDLIITYDTEPGLFEFKNRWLN